MKKNRIFYLHQYFNKSTESGSIRSDIITDSLKENFSIIIITLSKCKLNKDIRVERYNGKIVIYLPFIYHNSFGFFKRIYVFIKYILVSTIILLKFKKKYIYATSTPLTIIIPALIARFFNKTDYILEIRDQWPAVPIKMGLLKNKLLIFISNKLEYYGYKFAYKIVALSPGMYEGICRVYPNNKTITITNFTHKISTESCKSFDNILAMNKKIIIYPGTVGIVNHTEWLISFIDNLNDDYLCVIIGGGNRLNFIKSLVKNNNNLNDRIFFLNSVPKSQIFYCISNSYFLVSTVLPVEILNDNSANKFFDAISCSIPILINHSGWQKDLIDESYIGFGFDCAPDLAALEFMKLSATNYNLMKSNIKPVFYDYSSTNQISKLLDFLQLRS